MVDFEKIQATLVNGKRPDCPRCKTPESALVYESITEDFVCGHCFMEIRQKKKDVIKKLVLG